MGYRPLTESTIRSLSALEATNEKWHKVAVFLRGISNGEDPAVPDDTPEPIYSDLMRVSLSSRLAGVQPPRTLEIISVGFGDPATGIDLFSLVHALSKVKGQITVIPENVEQAIQEFEAAAAERAIIAQRLRSLITGDPLTDAPENLPIAIRLLLAQIEAVSNGKAIPLDPTLVGLAAIRTRHGGGPMGDCIMFSLQAMARGSAEMKTLANYLWSIANSGPAGPAPVLKEPQMAAIAEEVRCLAEQQIGGIRLMMKQATPQTGYQADQGE